MNNGGLGSWIHKRRVKSRNNVAVVSGDTALTYGEMAGRVDRLANALADRGVRDGDRVAYLGNNHPAFLETLFACGQLGAVFVPLNTRLAAAEISYALGDSGSTLLVNASSLEPLAVAGSRGTGVVRRLVVDDGAATPSAAPRGDGDPVPPAAVPAESYGEAVAAASEEHGDVQVGLDDTAIILYTSGTTGRPKGAVLTHGNLTWNSINVLVDYDVTSREVALMIAPMFHVASLGMGALPTLLKGGTVVLQDRFEPSATLAAIERHGVTSLSGVPTTFQMLAEHPGWDTADLSTLTKLTCGGSAVPSRVMDAYERRGLSFSGGYGMTETSPGATSLQPERSRDKAGSAGLPHFFSDIRIVDAMGGQQPPGAVGEILISGPNVIPRYWNRPEATADSFADGAWFRSGDMGYVDDEGFLYISDRLKDMIISGGENIYPAEVEQLVMELDSVAAVAVVGVPDDKWGEVPLAVVVPAEGRSLTARDVTAHLDGRLARYKIPKSVEFVRELPRTASGKIRKADVRRQFGG